MLARVSTGAVLASLGFLVAACNENTGVITSAGLPRVAATPREYGAAGVVAGTPVAGGPLAVGSVAPDIMYESAKGRQVSLTRNRASVAIVAFVGTPEDDPCWLDPGVVRLAARFESMPITVVQISETGMPASAQCKPPRMMKMLIDSGQVAWNAFGRPAPGSLFLLDRNNRVKAVGTLKDPEPFAYEAGSLGLKVEHDIWPEDLND
ncbi:MAG: hypothetical protein ACE15C_10695 [Phycisphaerae bacterium]